VKFSIRRPRYPLQVSDDNVSTPEMSQVVYIKMILAVSQENEQSNLT